MSSTFYRYITTALVCVFSLSVYAENLTPVDATKDQSSFLKPLDISAKAPISSVSSTIFTDKAIQTPIHDPTSTINNSLPYSIIPQAIPATPETSTTVTLKIKQLQATQIQLQAILSAMQFQIKQLDAHLPFVKQQLEKTRATQAKPNESPQKKAQLQQLLNEYQTMQITLTGMMRQQTQLQSDMTASSQQLDQLQQTLTKSPTETLTDQKSLPLNSPSSAQVSTQNQAITPVIPGIPAPTTSTASAKNIISLESPTSAQNNESPSPVTTPIHSSANLATEATISPVTTLITPTQISTKPAISKSSIYINDTQKPVLSMPTTDLTLNTPQPMIHDNLSKNTASVPSNTISNSATVTLNPNKNTENALPQIAIQKSSTISLMSQIQDPVVMLRTGFVFIGLALLSMLIFFWPRSKHQKSTDIQTPIATPEPKTELDPLQPNQDEELTSDYDFMNTEEAIPTRLDLARGYIEMNKYEEAKEAIAPIFEKGNDQQKIAAKQLLDTIDQANTSH